MGDRTEGEDLPLIGIDGLALPRWAVINHEVAAASWWRTVVSVRLAVVAVVRLAWRASPGWTALAAVVHLLSAGASTLGLLVTASALTGLLADGPTPARVVAALPAITVAVMSFAARAGLEALVGLLHGVLAPHIEHAARHDMHAAVLRVPTSAFDDPDFAELVRQGGMHGVWALRRSTTGVGQSLSTLVTLVAALVAVAMINPWLLPALVASVAASAWAAMRSAKLGYASYLKMITTDRQCWVVGDLIVDRDAAAEVRAFTLQQALLAEHLRISGHLVGESVRVERRQAGVRLIGRVVSGAGLALAYLILGLLLYTARLPLALAGAAVVAMSIASGALRGLMHEVNALHENCFYIDLYERLLDDARRRAPRLAQLRAPVTPSTIRLESVSYTYPGQDLPAVRGISATIRRGEVVAVVGENGSGKSTLGKLITGLYTADEGRVLWDEVDIAAADQLSVHERVSVISQQPVRWPVRAADNIRVGQLDRDSRDGSLWQESARASGADKVIESLPRGERTMLSRLFEHGNDLSAGQWQRLAVARGDYRDAAILVADEPTSALDARAEADVVRALTDRRAAPARTTVLITHRLANIRHADTILVLDRGKLVEQGSHAELITRDGKYAELYSLQREISG